MSKWQAYYYTTSDGTCELTHFLDGLPANHRQKVLAWITMLEEEGPTLPRPYADLLEDGIHELRVKLSGDQVRILYFFVIQKCIILTHSFIKKASAVPKSEIVKAKKCRDDFNRRFKTLNDFIKK
jgi:phage-related protein